MIWENRSNHYLCIIMIIIINFTMFIMIKPTKVLRHTVDFLFYLFGKGKNDDSDYSCCIKLHIRVTTTKRTVLMILHPLCPIFSTKYIPTSLQIYLLLLLRKIIYAVFFSFLENKRICNEKSLKIVGFSLHAQPQSWWNEAALTATKFLYDFSRNSEWREIFHHYVPKNLAC